MATKEELVAREGECSSAVDFATLIREAVAVDADYAKELVDKGEMAAQMPPDYLAVAEAAHAIGEEEAARNLFEQAEDMCFEPLEFAAVGAGLASTGLDKEKGAQLLKQAADQASRLEEFLAISGYAEDALGDKELASALLAKVEEKAKGLDDYAELAKSVKETGAEDMARGFYEKAARYCSGAGDAVKYAEGMIEIFGDKDWARSTLEGTEGDCQFPKDFAELAAGFKSLFDDSAKVAELMQQGADFAMSAEENLDLANGYWHLMQNREKAVEAYEKALPELNDKNQLVELAGLVAGEMDAKGLAKRMYAKAEEKMSSANDLVKLSEAVIKDTGDKDYALAVFKRAGESLTQPNDLMNLGANIVDQLDNSDTATVMYRKAFDGLSDFAQYLKLLGQVDEKLGNKAFCREILEKAAGLAAGTPELLKLAEQSIAILGDKELARGQLEAAEAQVTSVGEMKDVVATVKIHFAEVADWVALAEEKLARREANQAKYAVFQEREKAAATVIKKLQLADQIMEELEDRFYAQKLLVEAQKLMDETGWDLTQARMLIAGVSRHLGDTEWATRLLNDAAGRATGFAALRTVAEMAVLDMNDKDAARKLATGYLKDFEAGLADTGVQNAYDFSKLASAAAELADDTEWAKILLNKAAEQGGDHFAYAELAGVARNLGDEQLEKGFLKQAAEVCETAADAGQLVNRLSRSGYAADRVRETYAAVKSRLGEPREQLAWVEGLINLFGDRQWAEKEYDELTVRMGDDPVYQNSRKLRLGKRFF